MTNKYQESTGKPAIFIFFILLYNSLALAHDGHEAQDKIIPNLGDLGKVEFAISCGNEQQKIMNTGVGLLHHMMYAQAEKHFSISIKNSPKCAMFYWGYSMSLFHPLWPDKITDDALAQGELAIMKAQSLSQDKREKSYINAAFTYFNQWQTTPEKQRIKSWAIAQESVFTSYPQDIDAIAFYGLTQLVIASKTDTTFSQQKKVGEMLSKILSSSPTHPGAIHYTIHAYDNPALAEQAIAAARAYDKIAPDVPHALHMPSHIFVRLGLWEDAAKWNIRSANAALKYPAKEATSLHYVHALDYLVYSYLQSGNNDKAQQSYDEISRHHPIQAVFPVAYALTTIPARIVLENHQWKKASQLKVRAPDYIQWDNFPQVEAITYFARGLGAARSRNVKSAKESLAMLEKLHQKTMQTSPNYWAKLVEAQQLAVSAWISFSEGNQQQALKLMSTAADLEDSIDKNPVTPGAVVPSRELQGDMLMMMGKYAQAYNAYQACLKINPNRLNSVLGSKAAKLKSSV